MTAPETVARLAAAVAKLATPGTGEPTPPGPGHLPREPRRPGHVPSGPRGGYDTAGDWVRRRAAPP